MSVTGVCQLCESAQARFACDRCGRVVCADHYDRGSGLCTDCAKQRGGEEKTTSGRERGDRPDDWGEPR
ncbi:hypothetical protein [Halocalculus aciditolerans]|uniref:HIT-type domain-containing protein n=1 Tax=Halocalculus aciditolerans TaxID=1383812 RepID=A0A830FGG2_9EURY|nr:hypothetical protein [Halocalculus aciditolerans]GGL50556.1 hypothetical protein GCM10009039_05960 [Halocalculus aciditolerans]